jgi:ABC-type branched-subunit amino acid transport system ATPase component
VLWVEQRVADVLAVADRAILLRDGRAAAETSNPEEWLSADVLAAVTFGGSAQGGGE